ncbi:hypothetical protein RCZ04_03880 [Capnocytophaga sp. HP1101]
MSSLSLSEFVKNAIIEVSKGIDDAIEELKDSDVLVNPTLHMGKVHIDKKGYERQVQSIDFDLIVTIEDSTDTTGKDNKQATALLKVVSLLNIDIGGKSINEKTETEKNTVVNRLKFSVPVCFNTNAPKGESPKVRVSSI